MIRDKKIGKKRILVIEDEMDICKIIAFRLKSAGYQVTVANDGETGLKKAKRNVPDLIILDLMLPGIPGEMVCKSLREDDRVDLQQIPIIMLTAKSGDVDRLIGKVIGANVYLTKPFDADSLIGEVSRALEICC